MPFLPSSPVQIAHHEDQKPREASGSFSGSTCLLGTQLSGYESRSFNLLS